MIEDTQISKNRGGGVKIIRGNTIFNDCKIINNESSNPGVGILTCEAEVNFNNCEIEKNKSWRVVDENGGGIMICGGAVAFKNTRIRKNRAKKGGGIYVAGNAQVGLDDKCIIEGNSRPQLYKGSDECKIEYDLSIIKGQNQ